MGHSDRARLVECSKECTSTYDYRLFLTLGTIMEFIGLGVRPRLSIHDHPKLVLGTVVAVFLLVLGLAIATAPLFSVSPPSLSSPMCTSSSAGLTCVAFVYGPSTGEHFAYEMIVASDSTVHCGQTGVVYFVVTNSTSGKSCIVDDKQQSCIYNQ
jgi:hypothetical protein